MESEKFPACAIDGDYLYTVTLKEHVLEKINIKTYEIEYILDIGEYVEKGRKTVDLIKKNKGYIYLFEYNGKRAIQLDIKNMKSKIFQISQEEIDGYSSVEFYENKIYLLPRRNNFILIFDTEINQVHRCEPIFKNVKCIERNMENKFEKVCSCSYFKDEKIYIFSSMTNVLSIYDVIKNTIKNIELTLIHGGVKSMQVYNNKSYVLDSENKLWQFNTESCELSFIVDTGEEGFYYGNFIVTDKNIVFLPRFGEIIKIYSDNKLEVYSHYPQDITFENYNGHSKFCGYCDDKENYYIAMHSANYLLIIEKHTGRCKWIKLIENYEKYLEYHDGFISEEKSNLKEYILHIIER